MGRRNKMTGIAEQLAPMSDKTKQRLDRAMATIADRNDGNHEDELAVLIEKRDGLIAAAA